MFVHPAASNSPNDLYNYLGLIDKKESVLGKYFQVDKKESSKLYRLYFQKSMNKFHFSLFRQSIMVSKFIL